MNGGGGGGGGVGGGGSNADGTVKANAESRWERLTVDLPRSKGFGIDSVVAARAWAVAAALCREVGVCTGSTRPAR